MFTLQTGSSVVWTLLDLLDHTLSINKIPSGSFAHEILRNISNNFSLKEMLETNLSLILQMKNMRDYITIQGRNFCEEFK